ncbi:MAG: ADP-ribosylglycohydrolase family protein, partial [Candidatus Riflebacteria bacterium]|nr:ADP-ribosylglycohydrolase family protein [Candidatus Riflebacteria bacterium]
FMPPLSGQIRNQRWRDSNGAWIRSEIWACVAPGCRWLAAQYAWEDACVDHGAGEGTWAEVFTATVESAAFVESDRDRLIEIGLSYIPQDCRVAAGMAEAAGIWATGAGRAAIAAGDVPAAAWAPAGTRSCRPTWRRLASGI